MYKQYFLQNYNILPQQYPNNLSIMKAFTLTKQSSLRSFHKNTYQKLSNNQKNIENTNMNRTLRYSNKQNCKNGNMDNYATINNSHSRQIPKMIKCTENTINISFEDILGIVQQQLKNGQKKVIEINQNNIIHAIKTLSLVQSIKILERITKIVKPIMKQQRSLSKTLSDGNFSKFYSTNPNIYQISKNHSYNNSQLQSNRTSISNKVSYKPPIKHCKKTKVDIQFDFSDINEQLQTLKNKNRELSVNLQKTNEHNNKLLDTIVMLNEQLTHQQGQNQQLQQNIKQLKDKVDDKNRELVQIINDMTSKHNKVQEQFIKKQEQYLQNIQDKQQIIQNLKKKAQQKLIKKNTYRHQSLDVPYQLFPNLIQYKQSKMTPIKQEQYHQNTSNQQDLRRCLFIQAFSIQKMLQYNST